MERSENIEPAPNKEHGQRVQRVESWNRRRLPAENRLVPCTAKRDDKAFIFQLIRNQRNTESLMLNLESILATTRLNLSSLNYDLTDDKNSRKLGRTLYSFINIKQLNFSNNKLGILNKDCISKIFLGFRSLKELEKLTFEGNGIDNISDDSFCELLKKITEERDFLAIYLDNNNIYNPSLACLNDNERSVGTRLIKILNSFGFFEDTSSNRLKFVFNRTHGQ